MKRIVAVVVMAWLATGCLDAIPCSATTPCAEGVCSAEGVCVRGGATDGSSGGQDGGADAGADAGRDAGPDAGADAGLDAGVDGGFDAGLDAGPDAGADAGLMPCPLPCSDWQTCRPALNAGVCEALSIEVTSPDAGTEFAGNSNASFAFRVVQWDGEAWLDGGLPTWTSAGERKTATWQGGAQYAVTYALPGAAGPFFVGAGWGTVDAGVSVNVLTCDASCSESQRCVPSVTGGSCQDVNATYTVLAPQVLTVGKNAQIELRARVYVSDGGIVQNRLTWDAGFTGGVMNVSTGSNDITFATTFSGGSAGGTFVVSVGQPGAGAAGSFTVDATAPDLTVEVLDAGAYAYGLADGGFVPSDSDFAGSSGAPAIIVRRDETVRFRVTSSASDVDGGSAQVALAASAWKGGSLSWSPSSLSACSQPDAGYCAEFSVSVPAQSMPAFRATFHATASAQDIYGNGASGTSQEVGVTRWKWASRATRVLSGGIQASPAVGDGGILYLGVNNTNDLTGGLVAVSPDGIVYDAGAVGPVVASPSIGRTDVREWVFFETTAAGALHALDAVPSCGGAGSGNVGSLAIVADGKASMSAFGLFAGVSGTSKIAEFDSSGCIRQSTAAAGVSVAGNIVTQGSVLWVANNASEIDPYSIGGLTLQTAITPSVGTLYGVSLTASAGAVNVVGGGGNGLFVRDGVSGVGTGFTNGNKNVGGVAISGDGGVLFAMTQGLDAGANSGRLCRFDGTARLDVANVSAEILSFPATSIPGATTPILGQGGGVYVVSSDGDVLASRQLDLATSWRQALPPFLPAGSVTASPTLDCNWQRPGTGTGILYFATGTGWLVAYIVDSPGLDRTAAWPKYQHDVRNTGNSTVPIDPCP